MPQFDPSTYLAQFFWLCVCLVVLLSVSLTSTLPRIRRILEKRAKFLQDNHEEALLLHTQASEIQQKFENQLRGIKNKNHQTYIQIQSDIEIDTSHQKKQITEQFKKELEHYTIAFEAHHQNILDKIDPLLIELVYQILMKISYIPKEDPLLLKNLIAQTVIKMRQSERPVVC